MVTVKGDDQGAIARSLLLIAPRRVEWVEDRLPTPQEGDVLVKTVAGAVSVGSELAQYLGSDRTSVRVPYPRMTGYESIGTVRWCGGAVRGLSPGDRVLGLYGHRTHAVVPENRLIRVPAGVSEPAALLAILTCDVARGIRKVAPTADERVLIVGAGAIGCLTLWMLRCLGNRCTDVVEPIRERRELALKLGARRTGTPNAEIDGDVYNVGFECSDSASGFALLQNRMSRGARICVLSDGNGAPLCLTPAFHERELSVVGSSDGTDYPEHAAWFFAQPPADLKALEDLFDWTIPAGTLPGAFEQLASGRRKAVKVLVRYGDRNA